MVFNIKELMNSDSNVKNALFFNVLKYAWGLCLDTSVDTVLMIDEAHVLLGDHNSLGADFLAQVQRRARKYNTGTIIITQQPSDFSSPDVITQGKAIFDNASYYLVMGLKKQAVEDLVLHNYAEYKQAILQNIKQEHILVSTNKSVDNIISICFKGVRGETILHMLESLGFMIGTGSACNSKAGLNRVLAPIVPKDYIEGAIRLSFGDDVTLKDCLNLGLAIDNAVAEYKARIKR